MEFDPIQLLNNRISDAIKRLSFLKPDEVAHVQITVTSQIRRFVEEKGDPFKRLTESLGPTFDKIKNHEKVLESLADEIREASTGFGKLVEIRGGVYPNLTVRGNSRLVIKEFAEGTVLRKTLYRSKRGVPCPECDGTGHESLHPGKARKCKHCDKGTFYPVKGVMLEVM